MAARSEAAVPRMAVKQRFRMPNPFAWWRAQWARMVRPIILDARDDNLSHRILKY